MTQESHQDGLRPPSSPGAERILSSRINLRIESNAGSGDGKGGKGGKGSKGGGKGGKSPEIERAMGLAYSVQEVLDHAQDEPCTKEIEKLVDAVRMAATSEGHSAAEVKAKAKALEDKVKQHGLAREVAELMLANKRNGMRRYEGIHEIIPGLYLSGMAALQGDSKQLEEKGINAVLSLTDFSIGRLPSCVALHKHVNVADSLSATLSPHFKPCADWIHKAITSGKKVMVHCVAGVSRSASICIAYLMQHHGYSTEQGRAHVKKKRPCTRPNESFIKQLQEFENTVPKCTSLGSADSLPPPREIPRVIHHGCGPAKLHRHTQKGMDDLRQLEIELGMRGLEGSKIQMPSSPLFAQGSPVRCGGPPAQVGPGRPPLHSMNVAPGGKGGKGGPGRLNFGGPF